MLVWDMRNGVRVAKVQTLGNGEWRSVDNVPLNKLAGGCFLNGSGHWYGGASIWSFHYGKEKFLRIPLPDDIIIINATYRKRVKNLAVLDSCLCVICFSFFNPRGSVAMDLWITKEYGVKESWVRQIVTVNNEWCLPLMRTDKGKILIMRENELYLCDPRTEVIERVKFEINGHSKYTEQFAICDATFFRL
ncbi:unnamed protein product [Cuscuta campestris]|uniref:F-box associated domain-containing protein n=1 Tax=Cuscuta campestris TaxID=132261 RepID=A0A484KLK5_9ASTE|nr:unnamed protein product [Cuscuta campestris]